MIIIHKLDEFNKIPWDKLNPTECSKTWSFGYGSNDSIYTISIPKDQYTEDVWELPLAIGTMLKISYERGKEEIKREVRIILAPTHPK
jgi:hypothetical protein